MKAILILISAMIALTACQGCVGYYDRDRGEYWEHERREHKDRDRDDRGDRDRDHDRDEHRDRYHEDGH